MPEPNAAPQHSAHLSQEVLLRAMEDALIGSTADGVGPTIRHKAVLEARRFLTRPSKDLTTVCTLAGLDPEAVIDRMVARIAAAPTPEELLDNRKAHRPPKPTGPEPERRTTAVYTMNGQTRTVAEWAEITGIDKHLIHVRLSKGWSVEGALTMTREEARHRAPQTMRDSIEAEVQGRQWNRGSPARLITHAGRTLTIKQWASITGLKVGTLKQRLAKGWTTEQALTPASLRGKGAPEPTAREQA